MSLSINTVEHKWVFLQICHPYYLSVCLSVQWVSCGKTVDLIWMAFRVVGQLGLRMRQLVSTEDCLTLNGNFEGLCGASLCNEWVLCDIVM